MSIKIHDIDYQNYLDRGGVPTKAKPVNRTRSKKAKEFKAEKNAYPLPELVDGEKYIGAWRIPLSWMQKAARLDKKNGKTAIVALAIWTKAIREKSARIELSTVYLKQWGVGIDAKKPALKRLQDAGLILLEERESKSPVIKIRYPDTATPEQLE